MEACMWCPQEEKRAGNMCALPPMLQAMPPGRCSWLSMVGVSSAAVPVTHPVHWDGSSCLVSAFGSQTPGSFIHNWSQKACPSAIIIIFKPPYPFYLEFTDLGLSVISASWKWIRSMYGSRISCWEENEDPLIPPVPSLPVIINPMLLKFGVGVG